ncbi:MAG: zf-TFIIB domain-containing protein [Kofleriaceae bacterium]
MDCPRCNDAPLIELDRDGVTIDRCERCRGIWLDRGELEKLTAKARDEETTRMAPSRDDDDRRRRRDDDDDDDRRQSGRKRSWFDIFD